MTYNNTTISSSLKSFSLVAMRAMSELVFNISDFSHSLALTFHFFMANPT